MLVLAPRLRTRPSALWSRFRPAAPASPPNQQRGREREEYKQWKKERNAIMSKPNTVNNPASFSEAKNKQTWKWLLRTFAGRFRVYPGGRRGGWIASRSAQTEPPFSWTEVSASRRPHRSIFPHLLSRAAERTALKWPDIWMPDGQQQHININNIKKKKKTQQI